jgi:transcription elongation GreA/GreB family factor
MPGKEFRVGLIERARPVAAEYWPDWLAHVILAWDPDVGELAVDELARTSPEALDALLLEVFSRSEQHFEAFVPLARRVLAGRLDCPEALSRTDIYQSLATGANRLKSGVVRVSRSSDAVYRAARAVLIDQKIVRKVADETPAGECARLYSLVESLRRLDARPARILEQAVNHAHPEVFHPVAATDEDDDAIYTTRAGLEKLRRQYDQLMHEEIPKVAEALGHAISLGDISDNAEYRSARQRQQDLVSRAKQMREDLSRARERGPDKARLDPVGFGAEVTVTNLETGQTARFQILGPWDVDVERGVISYLSPLGQGFRGARAGEEVTIRLPDSTSRYRIETVQPASLLAE